MEKTVDARGLACPQPVINAKKALEEADRVVVIVDNAAALENVTRMARSAGCGVKSEEKTDGIYIILTRDNATGESLRAAPVACSDSGPEGPTVVVFSGNTMGRGDDALGALLMKSLIHTMAEAAPFPDTLVLFNTAVKLAAQGSETLEDLKALEAKGVGILACGTCLNYFKLTESLSAGKISNMYEIKETMFAAGRLIQV